jgi:hypothetical protein
MWTIDKKDNEFCANGRKIRLKIMIQRSDETMLSGQERDSVSG